RRARTLGRSGWCCASSSGGQAAGKPRPPSETSPGAGPLRETPGGPRRPAYGGPMATRRHDELVGSDTVAERTGRPREEWHGLLDAAGATSWTHKQIADLLVTEHGVDGSWSQGITVGYQQARGMRLPGQRPDGTFDAN